MKLGVSVSLKYSGGVNISSDLGTLPCLAFCLLAPFIRLSSYIIAQLFYVKLLLKHKRKQDSPISLIIIQLVPALANDYN